MSDAASALRTPVLDGEGAARLAQGNQRIVVTGAGGWLGLATLELLRNTLGEDAFVRRVRCFGSSERTLSLRDGAGIVQAPLDRLSALPPQPTLLLHGAFLTKDVAETMDDAAYAAANRAIRNTVFDALDPIGVEALFVPSSGAARQADDPAASDAMRLYGTLKREDEEAFAGWADRTGRTAAIVRVFNLSGRYINKPQHYALANFILDALAGRGLVVRAPRPVLRSYVAIRELMSIVFGLLTGPAAGAVRFDTAGDDGLEMEAVAQAVARVLGPVPVTRAALTETRADDYVGDRAAYEAHRAALGVVPIDLAAQIQETAAYFDDARARLETVAGG